MSSKFSFVKMLLLFFIHSSLEEPSDVEVPAVPPPNEPKLGGENDACASKDETEDFADEKIEGVAVIAGKERGV